MKLIEKNNQKIKKTIVSKLKKEMRQLTRLLKAIHYHFIYPMPRWEKTIKISL